MKIIAIIQARTGSTRYPNKVLEPLGDKTVLEVCYDRVKASYYLGKNVIVAIPETDTVLESFCREKKLQYGKGSEEDVLSRYIKIGKEHNADAIVRITADCPLVDYRIIDDMLQTFMLGRYDYCANNFFGEETYPDGLDCEVVRYKVLKKVDATVNIQKHREHVTSYIRENKDQFKCHSMQSKISYGQYRVTLDTHEDYKVIYDIYKDLSTKNKFFDMMDIVTYLEKHPFLLTINRSKRNESYYKQMDND